MIQPLVWRSDCVELWPGVLSGLHFNLTFTTSIKSALFRYHGYGGAYLREGEYSYKVIFFMWRILSNALPTCVNLEKRKCIASYECPICHLHIESVQHIFWFCTWVRKVCFANCFTINFPQESNFDMTDWIRTYFQELKSNEWELAVHSML